MKPLTICNFMASRSVHFDRAEGSFCCSVSVCDDFSLSRCQESGSRVVFGNIKQSNPPPEKRKGYSKIMSSSLHSNICIRMMDSDGRRINLYCAERGDLNPDYKAAS
jgi:hypothetical protein